MLFLQRDEVNEITHNIMLLKGSQSHTTMVHWTLILILHVPAAPEHPRWEKRGEISWAQASKAH